MPSSSDTPFARSLSRNHDSAVGTGFPAMPTPGAMRQRMRTFQFAGFFLALLIVVSAGCATVPPPSETDIAALRAEYRGLMARVSSGELTAGQARDRFYATLNSTYPPPSGLDALNAFRRQVAAQLETGQLSREQAESLLTDRELDMLRRWANMAAQETREQRAIQRLRDEQEQGLWQQKQLEQGEKVFRDRPRL